MTAVPGRSRLHTPTITTGFTLVEMLVTIAILSILFVVMVGILDQSSRAWNQAEQRVDAFREGRAAQFVIDQDLENLVAPEGQPFFFLNRHPDDIQIGATLPPADHGDTLFFTTLLPLDAQAGSRKSHLCIVGYYLAYTPDSSGPGARRSYKLYRHLTSSDTSFEALSDFFETGSAPLLSIIPRPPSGLIGDEVLARNIINLNITPLRRNSTNGELETPSAPWETSERPALVKVAFDALNYNTAGALTRQEDWQASPEFESLRQRNKQTFTSTIRTDRQAP